ncbi:DUF58 domain-containing protein [Thioflexithrix psekupsensis]|uniref:DUF58 domain-containing protein n=1 Tax=Thioflexithrix psekupsensis TaxID=1570016 RepID=A0A251X8P4_9GAMM|nr:DUF58 domain-containing protein [Thioflexithrix psekupsensis]OUD13902.1 hypothetical protein TPSD3_06040 [Thioflexithrix psekupsensis]
MTLRPANTLLYLLIIWSLLALLVAFQPFLLPLWTVSGGVLAVIAIIDAWQVYRCINPHITREVANSLALNVWNDVELQLSNSTKIPYYFTVFDDYPLYSTTQGLPYRGQLPAKSTLALRYRLKPYRRGESAFKGVHLRVHSKWHCWEHRRFITLNKTIRIYPNFSLISKYALLATENRLGQLGIRKRQRRGEGLDFHQLREYQEGDALRQIDWKATARYRRLISREYQEERDQQIVFLIDCGRRMLAQDDELSHFDHTLNAILLLSYVALRQGDALGLMTFSGTSRWFAPRKGMNTINLILNTVYDLQPSIQASDYVAAAQSLMQRQQRRALVVLISNLRDEDSSDLEPTLALLRQKHLVLLASLQEQILTEVLEKPIQRFSDAIRYAATHDYLQQRHHAHEQLAQKGVLYVDTTPTQLPIRMVNRYLEIKRSGQL